MKKTRFFSKIDPPRGASKYTVIRAGKPVKRYGRRMTKGRFLTSGRVFWGPDPPKWPMSDFVRFFAFFRIFLRFFSIFFTFLSIFMILYNEQALCNLWTIILSLSLLIINIANTQTSCFRVFGGPRDMVQKWSLWGFELWRDRSLRVFMQSSYNRMYE